MTSNEYLVTILSKYNVPTGPYSITSYIAQQLLPSIMVWGGGYLLSLSPSGSNAKGTAVKGSTDIDLFVSLSPQMPKTLAEIYESLFTFASDQLWVPRRQNVSIGVNYLGKKIDLVPAKKQPGNTNDHSLYRRKAHTWTKTNVESHIRLVSQSKRINEIKLFKVWRNLHNLEFPSFYLELTVMNALKQRGTINLSDNFWVVLQYLDSSFITSRVVDPANTQNIISEDLTVTEKYAIAMAARKSLAQSTWEKILW